MATINGPNFIALQVRELERSAQFYTDIIGLSVAPSSRPDAVVFLTSSIPFVLRKPLQPIPDGPLGTGMVLWLECDNVGEVYGRLNDAHVPLIEEPTQGPFGMTFRFQDPDGYTITLHQRA